MEQNCHEFKEKMNGTVEVSGDEDDMDQTNQMMICSMHVHAKVEEKGGKTRNSSNMEIWKLKSRSLSKSGNSKLI